jgi:hypothetical protein
LIKKLNIILLSIWLILWGLASLVSLGGALGLVLDILGIVAGLLILYDLRSKSLSRPLNLGFLLLGIWLAVISLLGLLSVGLSGIGLILDIVAVAGGGLILFGAARKGPRGYLGQLLLGLWLVLVGLLSLLSLGFSGSGTVLALLAIAAGVVLLLGR